MLENEQLRRDLQIQKQDNEKLKAQLEDYEIKVRESQISIDKATTRMVEKMSELDEKNSRIERLQDNLAYTCGNYEEVLDEIESAGVELTAARQEIARMEADGIELEDRLDEEEEENRKLRFQLELANKQFVVLFKQRDRDAIRIEALEQKIEATSLNDTSKKVEGRDVAQALVSMIGRAHSRLSRRITGARSGHQRPQQNSRSQIRAGRVRASLETEHARENAILQSSSSEHTGILLGMAPRTIANIETEEVMRDTDEN